MATRTTKNPLRLAGVVHLSTVFTAVTRCPLHSVAIGADAEGNIVTFAESGRQISSHAFLKNSHDTVSQLVLSACSGWLAVVLAQQPRLFLISVEALLLKDRASMQSFMKRRKAYVEVRYSAPVTSVCITGTVSSSTPGVVPAQYMVGGDENGTVTVHDFTKIIRSSSIKVERNQHTIASFRSGARVKCMDCIEIPESVLLAERLGRVYQQMKHVMAAWKHRPLDSEVLRLNPDEAEKVRKNQLTVFGEVLRPLQKKMSPDTYRDMHGFLSSDTGLLSTLNEIYKKTHGTRVPGAAQFVSLYHNLKYVASLLTSFLRLRKKQSENYVPTLAVCTNESVNFYDIFPEKLGYAIDVPEIVVKKAAITIVKIGSTEAKVSHCSFSPDYSTFACTSGGSILMCNPASCSFPKKAVYEGQRVRALAWCEDALFAASSETVVAIVNGKIEGTARMQGVPCGIACLNRRIMIASDEGLVIMRFKQKIKDASTSFGEAMYREWKELDISPMVVAGITALPVDATPLFTSAADGVKEGAVSAQEIVSYLVEKTHHVLYNDAEKFLVNDLEALGKKLSTEEARGFLHLLETEKKLNKVMRPLPRDAHVLTDGAARKIDKSAYHDTGEYHERFINFFNQLLKTVLNNVSKK